MPSRRTSRAWSEPWKSPPLVVFLAMLVGLEVRAAGATWAIEHARVIPSPTGVVLEDATVVVRDGKVNSLGPSASVHVPDGARRVDGTGGTVLAGYWNVHVHLTD